MSRKNISTETTWESIFDYSRIVRVGPYVYISGTTANDKSGNVVGMEMDVHSSAIYGIPQMTKHLTLRHSKC